MGHDLFELSVFCLPSCPFSLRLGDEKVEAALAAEDWSSQPIVAEGTKLMYGSALTHTHTHTHTHTCEHRFE